MSSEKKDECEEEEKQKDLVVKRHMKYFQRCLNILPSACQNLDTSRMTLLFFALSGLDVLGCAEAIEDYRKDAIEWIYAQQILPDPGDPEKNIDKCGFRGSSFLGVPFQSSSQCYSFDCGHVTMTYTALANLLILGDDLSRVNRKAILRGIKALQQPDGSFCSTLGGSETDMRFVYCACSVSRILDDWSAIDIDSAVKFIKKSTSYDCGLGQGPFLECHGGSTFCAIASLVLMDKLDEAFSPLELERLKRWCIFRQVTGFQGRPNKPADTCYSFWIGATLTLLGCSDLINNEYNRSYVLSTEGKFSGGFSKWPSCNPDPMHSYLGLCGLSLAGEPGLLPIHPALNITQRAASSLNN